MIELLRQFPDSEILLGLQPEELGIEMLSLMKKREHSPSRQMMAGNGVTFLLSEFENELWGITPLPRPTQYPRSNQQKISSALSEAWTWLERETLLVPEPGVNGRTGGDS